MVHHFGGEEFDCSGLAEEHVFSEVDDAHSAFAQYALNPVGIADDGSGREFAALHQHYPVPGAGSLGGWEFGFADGQSFIYFYRGKIVDRGNCATVGGFAVNR
jgi:hypothetical protein